MRNFFDNSSSQWVRYDSYIWQETDGKLYLMPAENAKPEIYDPLKSGKQAVIDALNIGRLCMSKKPDDVIRESILEFAKNYGMLGLMTALPTTANFMDYEYVYLPKNRYIKAETMATVDYLALFFPTEKPDVTKRGVESIWNIENDRTMIALAMVMSDKPTAMNMSFQRGYCSLLKQIDLPTKLEVLGKNVFESCSSLTSIILPAGLKVLKSGSLEGIPFEKIEIAPENQSFIKRDGVLYSKDGKILIRVSIAYSGNEFIIPDGVTEVMAYAFKKCKKINSLVFPDSVSIIGEYACAEMDSLTSVRLPSELTELAEGLFNECENLKNVIWPHKFTVIGNECLSGCKKLVPYIPDTLETIGEQALEGTKLDKLVLPKTIKRYNKCCGRWVNSTQFNLEVYDSRITDSLGSLIFESSCITVKSSETEEVLYKIWVVDNLWDLTDSQPLEVSRAFTNGWKNDGFFKYEMPGEIHIIDKSMDVPNGLPTEIEQAFMNSQKDSGYFDFETLDNVFPKIKGTMNKIKTAMNRLMYPISLTPEKDEMYRSYISKMGSKIVMHFIEEGDLESIRYVSQFDAIKKSNISNLVEAAATAKKTEIAAFLLNYKNEHLK